MLMVSNKVFGTKLDKKIINEIFKKYFLHVYHRFYYIQSIYETHTYMYQIYFPGIEVFDQAKCTVPLLSCFHILPVYNE